MVVGGVVEVAAVVVVVVEAMQGVVVVGCFFGQLVLPQRLSARGYFYVANDGIVFVGRGE